MGKRIVVEELEKKTSVLEQRKRAGRRRLRTKTTLKSMRRRLSRCRNWSCPKKWNAEGRERERTPRQAKEPLRGQLVPGSNRSKG